MCVPFRGRNLDILNITVVKQIAKLGFRKCSDTVIVSTASLKSDVSIPGTKSCDSLKCGSHYKIIGSSN